ncbi:hypothetical protein BES34_011100 [Leptospira inadai serovar Lyme]|uniref:Uncharacterized protein n=1 Tax=Leptospira inadai serovar Lyme TaxID=293084 RepID=A0ABX4YHR3_9LEPT|nr:hypothetical protein BES34_011100 [Leptospira inadai serovar Lyme]
MHSIHSQLRRSLIGFRRLIGTNDTDCGIAFLKIFHLFFVPQRIVPSPLSNKLSPSRTEVKQMFLNDRFFKI